MPKTKSLVRSESQTLITGVYRTGSEFIAQLLSCHSQLSVTMYRVNILRFCVRRFDPIHLRENWQAALDAIEHRVSERYGLNLDRGKIEEALFNCEQVTYGILYDVVMSSLYLSATIMHWAEKCQLLWREIPTFLDIMPNGKAILVIRDPRSVLASFKHYTYAPPPAYLGAVFNCFDSMKWGMKMARELPKDRFLIVSYEDAARNPSATVAKMFEFLDLELPINIQDRSGWRDAYGKPWIANSSFDVPSTAKEFDVEASIGRWRNTLSETEVSFVETICGRYMSEFGYCPSEIQAEWPEMLRLFMGDEVLSNYFRKWLFLGEGVQEFPTDPLNPTNWRQE